jgi:hypothetical protein
MYGTNCLVENENGRKEGERYVEMECAVVMFIINSLAWIGSHESWPRRCWWRCNGAERARERRAAVSCHNNFTTQHYQQGDRMVR